MTWIPISSRLPEVNWDGKLRVLLTVEVECDDGRIGRFVIVGNYVKEPLDSQPGRFVDLMGFTIPNVVAWMVYPMPYQGA
jgi:hypothetical protein